MAKNYICILIVLINFNKLNAQDSLRLDSSKHLKEVLVTYQAGKFSPISFQNIGSKELKFKSTGQEPSFLLSETPSITNYSDAGNSQSYSYFRMRGIDQTRINITLDGVPLNEPEDQGAYFSNYPDILNSLSKIQIQRGVGTTKNGVASYGGSIQLFSNNLEDSTKTCFGLGFGSFKSFRAYSEYSSGVKNKRAFYIRASDVYSDGYKYHSSNNSQSIFMSGGLFYDKSTWKINLLAGHQQNELAWLGVSDSLISIDRKTNANKNEHDRFTQCLFQIQNTWHPKRNSFLQSSIYYTYLNGNYDFNLNNFLGFPSTNELYNYAFKSNLIGVFCNYTLSNKKINWTSGVHGNIYDREHIGSINTTGQLYKNTGYKKEGSFFSKVDYKINKLNFFADLQYRYSTFDYKGSVSLGKMEWNFFNPKAGLTIEINPNAIIYYSIGRAGREPSRNDMFGGSDDLLSDSLGKAIISISKPEYVTNQELGFRYHLNSITMNLNLYYMEFNNEIVLNGKFGPNGLALTNEVERSYRSGIELSASYKVNNHLLLTNNSSFNYSRIKEQKVTFSPILNPPIIINQEAVYSNKGFLVSLSARYQDNSFIDFANTSKVNSYVLLNGRIGYNIKRLEFCVFVNNITNAKYFNNGYVDSDGSKKYFVQATTNLYFQTKYSF